MPDLPRSHLLAYALVVLAVAVFVVRQAGGSGGAAEETASAQAGIRIDRGGSGGEGATGRGGPSRLVIHVAGAVRSPGVYRLREGARVDDAVRRAGGASRGADLAQLNLAAKLEDGRQVLVPRRVPVAGAAGGAAAAARAAAGGAAVVTGAPAAPVNLNTATPEQLDTLDGVGPVMVQKILQYRTEHGGFSSIEELGQIPGIGERRLAALRERVTL
jgi:competence protein ComEA